jgi:hypothetical protein
VFMRISVIVLVVIFAVSPLPLQAAPVDVDGDGKVGPQEVFDLLLGWKAAAIPPTWQVNGTRIFYNAGSVGIGTATPDTKFQVNDGRIRIRESATLERWDFFYHTPTQKFFFQENAAYNHLVFTRGPDNRIGIGTETPASKVDVRSSGDVPAISGQTPGSGAALAGRAMGGGNALIALSQSGTCIYARSGSGPGIDVDSQSNLAIRANSQAATCVDANSNTGIGVYGRSQGNYGVAGTSGSGIGVYASSIQTTGLYSVGKIGVHGIARDMVGAQGIRGDDATSNGSSPYTYAGYFQGRVEVNGALTKSSGSFKIDHPLDPANKYLSHSFVESPDMMNIYNGNATTDATGLAVITLPDWFEALNRDFRYQLTVLDESDSIEPVWAKVVKKVQGNQFMIRSSHPHLEVSWQVTGIRQDAWANAHRILVEEDKPETEKGKYLAPGLFGQPPEKVVQ